MFQIIVFGIWVAAVGGWIANIVKLIQMADGGITLMAILRIVGIITAPFGAILGFF